MEVEVVIEQTTDIHIYTCKKTREAQTWDGFLCFNLS